jgi:hypothetical protein
VLALQQILMNRRSSSSLYKQRVGASHITAIGAFSRAVVAEMHPVRIERTG